NPTPSTSGSYHSSSTLVSNQKFTLMEREIRTLEMQKSLLQQQLMQKDGQIDELQRTLSTMQVSNTASSNLEDSIIGRINDSFERLGTNISVTLGNLERRIENLEHRFKPTNGTTL